MSAKSAERKTNTKFGKSARPPGFLADLTWFGEPDQQNVHPPQVAGSTITNEHQQQQYNHTFPLLCSSSHFTVEAWTSGHDCSC